MKIRTGFVSNSSSSSFCLYGASLDPYKVYKLMETLTKKENRWEQERDFVELVKEIGLEYEEGSPHYDGLYVGRSYESMGMDETMRQMMDDVKKKVELLCEKIGFVDDVVLSEYSDSWYDG